MEIFGDTPGCYPHFDYLIIAGSDKAEHDQTFELVLGRAQKFGVRFNADKLQYCQLEVKFVCWN
jgi:hypothetical protein